MTLAAIATASQELTRTVRALDAGPAGAGAPRAASAINEPPDKTTLVQV